jgi:serine protease Do
MSAQEIAAIDKEGEEKLPQDLLEMFRQRMNRPRFGVGSGFIIDAEGYVLTNRHVVKDAARITVRLQSGEEFRGEVIGSDEETDLAVVKVKATRPLPVVKFGDSNAVHVGDWVLAIGSPFGLEQTVTAGIISKLQRESPQFTSFQQFLQTDAAINRGNSGGPLVNMRGEVIGINSQIATTTGDYNGIGFALPSNDAALVYQRIRVEGKVRRGYLGINPESVKSEYARVYGLSEAKGAIVANITDTTGPAAKAGIEVGDVIVEINGQQVQNSQDLITKIAATPVGQTVPVVVLREVKDKFERKTFNVTLGERPSVLANSDDETPNGTDAKKPTNLKLGLTLSEITPQIATINNLKDVRGVIIKEVDPNGIAADVKQSNGRRAFNQNDVITQINRVKVTSLADFDKVARNLKEGDAVVIKIVSSDRSNNRTQRIVQFTYQ